MNEADTPITNSEARSVALACLERGIEAAHPATVIERSIRVEDGSFVVSPESRSDTLTFDLETYDRVFVLGGGNASGQFARELEEYLGGYLTGGVVVTDDVTSTDVIDVLEGDHPIPTDRCVEGAREVLSVAEDATENDLVIGCITGGGSALLAAPSPGLSRSDLQSTTEALLASGATIDEINAVRKHLSAIKGGRLAQAVSPATVIGLTISDVVGDDLSVIASGPLSPDPTTFSDAIDVLDRYRIDPPDSVRSHLETGANGEYPETPESGDPIFDHVTTSVLANGWTALNAARETATDRGYDAMILSSSVEGEAREAAKTHAAIARECHETSHPASPPVVLLSGGETTVTLSDDPGEGGPNQEFALSGAAVLEDEPIVVASVDTDGIDGASDSAGALVEPSEIDSEAATSALARNDAGTVLENADALIRTGQTGTNVNDLRLFVVGE
ncbi:glycerate kinase type-2 family protein [Natrarchaeobius chitinivorans]|uniref:Glycerate kinase n=1 Tax=Natrarchaeobius chitinivorans TaxID=1679083 RepID=A0A3N6N5J8_NATCH|nr:glycerate kinase [Natrarchaeobius chitinivorans]RQG93562.1 glycerate kinase [Natrarchaeobius chitinivorans]